MSPQDIDSSVFVPTTLLTSTPLPDPSNRLPRVLFTGFGPFPGSPYNPTEHIMPLLNAAYHAGKFSTLCASLSTEIIDAEYATIPGRLATFAESFLATHGALPDIVVHFGLAPDSDAILLEPVAKNWLDDYPDRTGAHRPGKAVDDLSFSAEHTIPSRLPNVGMLLALEKRGIPATLNPEVGDWTCNYLFYLSASTSRDKACPSWQPDMVGFVHVPKVDEEKGMRLETMKDAAEAILQVCCEAWSKQIH